MFRVVVLIENSTGFGRAIFRGIARYATLKSSWTFYAAAASHFDPMTPISTAELKRIKQWGADGIIMREIKGMHELLAMHIPAIVSMYFKKMPPSGAATIYIDNLAIGRIAADHFLERGFKHFAFYGLDEFFWSRERSEGFCNRIAQAGFNVHCHSCFLSQARELRDNRQDIMLKWLRSLPLPIGLMACTDEQAQTVIEACKIAGLRIPDDVAIIGSDNDESLCELSNPKLSSIALNACDAGYEAAELLDQLMLGRKIENTVITVKPTHVVARSSSDILATDDFTVLNAVWFIREHAREAIQVSDVANAVTVSRRVLERRFRTAIRHSIYDEIKHVRFNEICKMLLETDMSISQIASTLGFSSCGSISRFFSKEKGITPLTYRKTNGSS